MKRTITDKRQLTIPKEILDKAGIEPGLVHIDVQGGKIVISEVEDNSNDAIVKLIKKHSRFKRSNITVVNRQKDGYTSETYLVVIDNNKYIYKDLGFYIKEGIDSISEKEVAANILIENNLFQKFIKIEKNRYLFEYIEGDLKKAIDYTESDYTAVRELSMKISSLVPINLITNNKINKYFDFILQNSKDFGPFSQDDVNSAKQYFDKSEKVFVHGDLNADNLVFSKGNLFPIDWDTFMLATKNSDIYFLVIQNPAIYSSFIKKIKFIDWNDEKVKTEFKNHIIYYYLRWKIIFEDHFDEFIEKYNVLKILEVLWN